jgi:hypothetical protein
LLVPLSLKARSPLLRPLEISSSPKESDAVLDELTKEVAVPVIVVRVWGL